MTQRLGVVGVKKTCSMALGDTGITPLQHTGAYAHFANGGKTRQALCASWRCSIPRATWSTAATATSRRRRRCEPQGRRGHEPDDAGGGDRTAPAQKAALDFTTVVGKTGTSSSYRDAWFVGFTGALVTGVWVGYDDFRPMPGITGGSLPTQAWHSYMQVAHNNYRSIPPILGIAPHPNQVADQQRLSELKRTDPGMAQAQVAQAAQKSNSLMPDQTRAALKKVAETMRRAAGLQAVPASAAMPAAAGAPAGSAPALKRHLAQPPGRNPATRTQGETTGGPARTVVPRPRASATTHGPDRPDGGSSPETHHQHPHQHRAVRSACGRRRPRLRRGTWSKQVLACPRATRALGHLERGRTT